MESTGVYWIAPHEVLERTGLEVVLVGTRQLARVPGRKKTDRVDCRWDSAIAQLRAAARLVPAGRTGVHATDPGAGQSHSGGGDWRLATADAEEPGSDECTRAPGGIGYRGGERDAQQLAQLRDRRRHQSEEAIAEQLSGHWRADHLFTLGQALKMYDAIQERIAEYEREIMEECRGQAAPKLDNPKKAQAIKKRGEEPLRQALYRIS